ncbi:MAG: DUF2752 domain-containing protein [Clostridia bacterium]|nr:DUF2752 domain-containing protein [Clostridia bacterium]
MKTRIRHPLFLLCHLIIMLGAILMPVYRALIALLPSQLFGCALHDVLFLYCPMCGGTRAVEALLHLDPWGAMCANAYVTVLLFVAVIADAVAWMRYFRKQEPLLRIPAWGWIAFAVTLSVWFVLRNYLMIAYGIDPTGDLGAFWAAVRS